MQAIQNFLIAKYVEAKMKMEEFMKNEKGEANIIAVILILAIVIAVVLIFKDSITNMVDQIFDSAEADVTKALNGVNRK